VVLVAVERFQVQPHPGGRGVLTEFGEAGEQYLPVLFRRAGRVERR
jgi:hypothetical protein